MKAFGGVLAVRWERIGELCFLCNKYDLMLLFPCAFGSHHDFTLLFLLVLLLIWGPGIQMRVVVVSGVGGLILELLLHHRGTLSTGWVMGQ